MFTPAMMLALLLVGAEFTAPPDPSTVVDGAVVPACAWPTAGIIYDGPHGRCTAVYVGGRVILTASHCVPRDFRIGQSCATDADCLDLSSLQGAVRLECWPNDDVCMDPDARVSNRIGHVRFGTTYFSETTGEEARKMLQILYCKKVDLAGAFVAGDPKDFAYCILSEEPNLQPIPIAVPCEYQAELGMGTQVVAVGYGKSSYEAPTDSGGTKRWATAALPNDNWTFETATVQGSALEWTTAGGAPVPNIAKGDSGGPLFAQMSDGTCSRWHHQGPLPPGHASWSSGGTEFRC